MTKQAKDLNLDPITGAPGAHPVGTGVGALAGGAAAGAAAGTFAGPVGTVVGAAIGAVAGGLAGKAVAEAIDPTVEHAHWEEAYVSEPYYSDRYTYEDYGPAMPWVGATCISTRAAPMTRSRKAWPRTGTCTAASRA